MPIPRGTLVELLDQYSNVYPASPTGARGWIRAKRELPDVDPEVYVEWDKTHWRYHGEKDGWTFEHHFRPVVDGVVQAPEALMPDLGQIIRQAQEQVNDERCPHCGDFHDLESVFADAIAAAQDSLLESEAFFIVAVRPTEDGDQVVYEPEIFAEALDPTAKRVIEAQLLSVAVQLFEQHLADISPFHGE